MTTLIHELCLSQSLACPRSDSLLVSHLIYLATTNMRPAKTEGKHSNLMYTKGISVKQKPCSECDPAKTTEREGWTGTVGKQTVRWKGRQTGNIPMSV